VQTTNATVEITWDCRASDQAEQEQWDCHVGIANGIGHSLTIRINCLRL
jgi:hypothetical protein